jgi:hypothetical protein
LAAESLTPISKQLLKAQRRMNMEIKDDHVELTETEASGGVKRTGLLQMLGASLFLAIIILSLMWIIPAVTN